MGTDRAQRVVALQEALMRVARDFGVQERVAPLVPRALAAAAALDYVLMLARNADTRSSATSDPSERVDDEARERAMHEGIERAVDDLLAAAAEIAALRTPQAQHFVAEATALVREALSTEHLETAERRFALIALINA